MSDAPVVEDFWPKLREDIRAQIRDIDAQLEDLHRTRDRLQHFLNDHADR